MHTYHFQSLSFYVTVVAVAVNRGTTEQGTKERGKQFIFFENLMIKKL